jgi:uncharacterized protein (TIRG00374 family)
MTGASAAAPKRNTHRTLLLVLTNLISVACLYWVLHDVDTGSLRSEVASMDWTWVLVAVVTDILVYVWHGWRWALLLSPIYPVKFWSAVRAIYVGLFANEILPFRTGEVIRCYLISRWTKLPLSVTLSSALVERLFDGIWLMVCLYITIQLVPLPQYLIDGGTIIGLIVLIGGLLLAAALFFKDQARAFFAQHRLLSKLSIVIEDLNIIGHSKYVYLSAMASLPYLLLQILPIYALSRGYGIDITLGQAAALMVILRLGSVPPQAPGNVGTFQALAVVGLQLFGVEQALAKRFSVVMWSVITLPLLTAGFVALAITGARLGELRKQAESSVRGRVQPQE